MSTPRNSRLETVDPAPLAWAGWQLEAPPDWRPLQIRGNWERGSLLAGNSLHPTVHVKWWRPAEDEQFHADDWIEVRLEKICRGGAKRQAGPHPAEFSHTAWVPEAADADGDRRSLWYGYAPGAGLVLEIALNADVPAPLLQHMHRRVLPSCTVSPADAPSLWAVFGTSFLIPADYRLSDRHLQLGDICLRFRREKRERILVRQVYPADLAETRRTLPTWLRFPPFKERRRFRGEQEAPVPWSVTVGKTVFEGVRRRGKKRLPTPLGRYTPLHSTAAVMRDTGQGRLLLAEIDSPNPIPDRRLETLIAVMNRPDAALDW